MRHLLARLTTPSGFFLAGLCFLLPFVTVSCEAPGGYGRAAAGGTTTYSGIDLAVGGVPKITPPEQLRPEALRQPDRLPPQPFALSALLLLVGGLVTTVLLRNRRARFPIAAGIAAVGVVFVLANQAIVEAQLQSKFLSQLRVPSLPPGKQAADYVKTGSGFGIILLILAALVIGNLIGWARRPRPARATPIPFESRREMRARAEAKAAERARLAAARSGNGPEVEPPLTIPEPRTGEPATPVLPVKVAEPPTDVQHHGPPGVDPWPDAPV